MADLTLQVATHLCFEALPYYPVPDQAYLGRTGIVQWLERRTRDRNVAGSNPCWSGGRIYFSRVDFLY